MIHIYKLENQDYEKNGDMTLFPISCTVYTELNGSWYVDMTHPIDKLGRWKYIVDNAVVKAPSFNGEQLFRIKTKRKTDSGIEVRMEPIFYDAISDCWLVDVRPTGKNGREALQIMLQPNSKYSAESDIDTVNTAYYQYLNFFEALNGDIDQSFIKRWGGEILYDNFKVIVNKKIGNDYGVELLYGKNIQKDGLTENIDMTSVVTRIYPIAYNGRTMSDYGYVDSPLIDNYPVIYTTSMKFDDVKLKEDAQEDDGEENGITVCETQSELDEALRKRCEEQYENELDKPKVTIEANLVLLQSVRLYSDYKMLETVSLGDVIHCKHTKLGIVTDARVIALEYDSIRKKVTAVTIGEFDDDYFNNVTSTMNRVEGVFNSNGSLMAERVQGILNGIYTQLRLQSTAAQKVDGIAFKVEDLDEKSPLYGCMIWGTQGIQISTKRTEDGRDWDWTTAVTASGIVADAIITGILSDKTGENYWNLDTGEFRLSSKAFTIDEQTVQEYVDTTIDTKLDKVKTLTLQLSNEFQGVPTDQNGENGDFSQCYTFASLHLGISDVTDRATYTVVPSDGVVGIWDLTDKKYTVTSMSNDTGTVSIKATYSNLSTEKIFSISKVKRGNNGVQGPPGEDGQTLYTWIKYADTPTSGMSDDPTNKKYMGIAINKTSQTESSNYGDYTWSLIQGEGIPGEPGEDGQTLYTWVKYADDASGNGISNSPDGKKYIGIAYNKTTQTESSNPSDYTWSLIQGDDGYSYFINLSDTVVSYMDEIFVPKTITANAYYRKGNEDLKSYSGVFKIYTSTNGTSYTLKSTLSNVSVASYTFTDKTVKSVKFEFYKTDGTTLLDRQTVTVIQDSGNGNLLKDTRNFTSDYWTIFGQFTRNLEAPDGSLTMASLKATTTESYLSAKKGVNTPLSAPGGYTFSVWLKADRDITIKISLNHTNGVIKEISVGTSWKQYNLSYNVDTITEYNHVTIGGWGSFSSASGATLYIWDPVVKRTLSTEEVFNMLTNDGKYQGIFMQSGQLYINGKYVEFEGAKIGGWQISGNQLLNNQTNFVVRLQAPTGYGTSGLGWSDVFTVHDLTNDSWPFVLTSDGTLDLGSYFKYRPNGMSHDKYVKLSVGGWQIKNGQGAWGYDHFEYWDTEQTQENGICSHGPWVIWGGWNDGPSLDYVNSYKFVVSDQGNIYGQRFYDNGAQLLPIITEVMHVTFTSGWTGIIKSGYFLLDAFLVRSDNTIYVDGIQRRSDGWYLVLLQQSVSAEADLYTVWCKNPD